MGRRRLEVGWQSIAEPAEWDRAGISKSDYEFQMSLVLSGWERRVGKRNDT